MALLQCMHTYSDLTYVCMCSERTDMFVDVSAAMFQSVIL